MLLWVVGVLALAAGPAAPARAGDAKPYEPSLNKGVQQAQEGEYQTAETVLREVISLLSRDPKARGDLVRAYIYLAVAHHGLNQEAEARAAFVEALKLSPAVETSTMEFPPSLVEFFDGVRRDAKRTGLVKGIVLEQKPLAGQAGAKPSPKKGGATKWVLIGGGAAAAAGGAVVLAGGGTNHAPSAGTISVSPGGAGILAVTDFSFSSQGASDVDKNPLTYTWDFGDGSAGTGATATHIFPASLAYTVTLNVSDGKLSQNAQTTVTVKSLSGIWVGTFEGVTRTLTLQQSARQISGTYYHSYLSPTVGPGTVTGICSSPRSVTFEASLPSSGTFTFTGESDDQVNTLTGFADGAGYSHNKLTFTRQ